MSTADISSFGPKLYIQQTKKIKIKDKIKIKEIYKYIQSIDINFESNKAINGR